jgi:hypothetical protein
MTLLGRSERLPPSEPIADAIVAAVDLDEGPRLTGSTEGDAVLMATYAFHESRWGWHWDGAKLVQLECVVGDGGNSFGPWQIQTHREIGCAVDDAARLWLHMAHRAKSRCGTLAEVVSGSCYRGRKLVAWRDAQAMTLLKQLIQ